MEYGFLDIPPYFCSETEPGIDKDNVNECVSPSQLSRPVTIAVQPVPSGRLSRLDV